MAYDRAMLVRELELDEAVRLRPYVDTKGKISIGTGRNLTDVGISRRENDLMLEADIEATEQVLDELVPWWRQQPDDIPRALMNLTFNVRRKIAGFHRMLEALQRGDRATAASELLDSEFARETGPRADRLARLIEGPIT